MVKSPVTQPSERIENRARTSKSKGGFLLVSIFRLLLLGISSSLAALMGMAIAQFYPDTAQEPPIVEKALRQSQNWVSQQKQALFPTPQPSIVPSPTSPIAPTPINQLPPPSTPLSKADRDKLQAELAQLQAQLKGLGDRAASIETQISSAATETPGNALMVTLPSDTLFDATQTSLRPDSLPILDSLTSDLQRYPGATVRVSGHVDEQGAVEADRSRSFEQAKAIKQYLSGKLGEKYQWVAIGYGHSRPLATSTSQADRQRNRRIEIAIDSQ